MPWFPRRTGWSIAISAVRRRASRPTSPGYGTGVERLGRRAEARRFARAPCGERRTTSCAPFPAWGNRFPSRLVAYLPELGALDRRQIAALVGVAPFNRDSGTLRGKRAVWGGRARVRATLYMGAMVASRHNPVIRHFYQKLWRPVNRKGWPWSLVCANCSSSSTPCSSMAARGVT